MTTHSIPIASITIPERLRKDYGDEEMTQLQESLRAYGLIQPVVINQDNILIAGGRRIFAAKAIGWTEILVVYKETLSEHDRQTLELEENLKRKDMTWLERTCSISRIHWLKVQANGEEGRDWGQHATAEMLGCSQAHVSHSLKLTSLINAGDVEVIACEGPLAALKLLDKREEEAAVRELAMRTFRPAVSLDSYDKTDNAQEGPVPSVPLSKMLHRQPTLSFTCLASFPDASFDHCITDPPYGIDLDNIDQRGDNTSIQGLQISHDVEANIQMFYHLFRLVHDKTRDKAFFCLWCDQDNWEWMKRNAIEAGWLVQRWPLVWAKAHTCMNQAAQYNFTKSHEICMICRKPNATLFANAPVSVITASVMPAKDEYGDHPFVKPREVWDYLIEKCTSVGQTILEPFAGRGSAVLPMLRAGRSPVAIEYDNTHYAYLVENVKKHYLSLNPNTKFV